jgi:hypothetical protein
MQQASSQRSQIPGSKLIIAAVIVALVPVIIEIVGDGGPANFGKPETGFALIVYGFFLWPIAFVLLLIGLKRLIFSASTTDSWKPEVPVDPGIAADIEPWKPGTEPINVATQKARNT